MRNLFFIFLFTFLSSQEGKALCGPSRVLKFEIEKVVERKPREKVGFTQGLEFHDGVLYESTGAFRGESTRINKIQMSGEVSTLKDQGQKFFGEGLTILNNKIYQLSWKERLMYTRDLQGGDSRKPFETKQYYPREGWGLTNDGHKLISSDGSERLAFHDPIQPSNYKTLVVRDNQGPVKGLNELEYVAGKVYANVAHPGGRGEVIRIDPQTGCVEARGDFSELRDKLFERLSPEEKITFKKELNFILNGIAFDQRSQNFVFTGKKWPFLFWGKMKEEDPPEGGGGSLMSLKAKK